MFFSALSDHVHMFHRPSNANKVLLNLSCMTPPASLAAPKPALKLCSTEASPQCDEGKGMPL